VESYHKATATISPTSPNAFVKIVVGPKAGIVKLKVVDKLTRAAVPNVVSVRKEFLGSRFKFRYGVVGTGDHGPQRFEYRGKIGVELSNRLAKSLNFRTLRSLPDVIISDLNMPRMPGFEFLAVVRQRFPHIATIAMSGGYSTGEIPLGILADAFLQKGRYTVKELFEEVAKLLAASPIRSERKKSDIAPLFVPRDRAGYLIITCPKCLRPNKLEAMSLNGGIHQTICQSCSMPVKFEINHEIEPLIKRKHV
jgi:CheY-like chemotaxis protein